MHSHLPRPTIESTHRRRRGRARLRRQHRRSLQLRAQHAQHTTLPDSSCSDEHTHRQSAMTLLRYLSSPLLTSANYTSPLSQEPSPAIPPLALLLSRPCSNPNPKPQVASIPRVPQPSLTHFFQPFLGTAPYRSTRFINPTNDHPATQLLPSSFFFSFCITAIRITRSLFH